jgi:hypothetical protein
MAASLDDILTTQKNGVVAINNLSRQLDFIISGVNAAFPSVTSDTHTSVTPHQEVIGSGRLFGLSVIAHSGSAVGYVYNSATVGAIAAGNAISFIPAVEGFYPVNIAYTDGLVLVAGSGMEVCITYSPN